MSDDFDDYDDEDLDDDEEIDIDVEIDFIDDAQMQIKIARALRYEIPRHSDSDIAIDVALKNLSNDPRHYDDLDPERGASKGTNLGLAFGAALLGVAAYILFERMKQKKESEGDGGK